MDGIDFESVGSQVLDFDDGHVPENIPSSCKARLVRYPMHNDSNQQVHVYDNLLDESLVQGLYQLSLRESSPWGDYVTVQEVREYSSIDNVVSRGRHQLAVAAVASYLDTVTKSAGTVVHSEATSPLFQNFDNIHGVAVWALASDENAQVEYHLDYAELIRYEHNVICPPLFAGTIQCTPTPMVGGEFCVFPEGLDHYQRHGYKSVKCSFKDTQMVKIPYKYNRCICHAGHLPHLSTPVKSLTEGHKRVIVGLNVFGNDIGSIVQEAPEHSRAFRNRIRMSRLKKQSLKQIQQNPALSKLLVLAKRAKIKQELEEKQRLLDVEIDKLLSTGVQMRLAQVMDKLGKSDGTWPNSVDVQVHVHHRILGQENVEKVICVVEDPAASATDKDILSKECIIYLLRSEQMVTLA